MIQNQAEGGVALMGISGAQSMGMKLNGKAFSALVDKLYTDKPGAVIREISANARDAMVQAGKGHLPFEIVLPNQLNHELVFRDEGIGLSKEDTAKYLGNLFESSKENENNSIGTYGLGSKSPFSVTDSYIVESRHNGEKHIFNWFRAPGGVPDFLHISSSPTDEPNGVTFKIPAPPSMYKEYEKSLTAQLAFFDPKPTVYGFSGTIDPWSDFMKVRLAVDGIRVVESSGLVERYGQYIAEMGGVLYPINLSFCQNVDLEAEEFDGVESWIERAKAVRARSTLDFSRTLGLQKSTCLVIKFAIGELDVPPSRESIEYGPKYNVIIREKLLQAEEFISKQWGATIKAEVDKLIEAGADHETCRLKMVELDKTISFHNSKASGYQNLTWKFREWSKPVDWFDNCGKPVDREIELNHYNFNNSARPTRIALPHISRDVNEVQVLWCPVASESTPGPGPEDQVLFSAEDVRKIIADYAAWHDGHLTPKGQAPLRQMEYGRYEVRHFERLIREQINSDWKIADTEVVLFGEGSERAYCAATGLSGPHLKVSITRHQLVYEPAIELSRTNVIPDEEVQTCRPPLTVGAHVLEFFNSAVSSYRANSTKIFFVIEDKEIDQRDRRLGFYFRVKVLEDMVGLEWDKMSEDQRDGILDIYPRNYRKHVMHYAEAKWLRFARGDRDVVMAQFKLALELAGWKEGVAYEFLLASELPKLWQRKGTSVTSTLRGARQSSLPLRFYVESGRSSKSMSFRDSNYSDFQPLTDKMPPGLVLYNNGDTSDLYFDREMTRRAYTTDINQVAKNWLMSQKEHVKALRKVYKDTPAQRTRSYDVDVPIYRLTPSAHKHDQQFFAAGCFDGNSRGTQVKLAGGKPNWRGMTPTLRSAIVRVALIRAYERVSSEVSGYTANLMQTRSMNKAVKTLSEFSKNKCVKFDNKDNFEDNWLLRYVVFFRPLSAVDLDIVNDGYLDVIETLLDSIIAKFYKECLEWCSENPEDFIVKADKFERSSEFFDAALNSLLAKIQAAKP